MAHPLRKLTRAALVLAILLLALFTWNGLEGSWREPEQGGTQHPARQGAAELRLMTWNLAKCGFHRGGLTFADDEEVLGHLAKLAEVVRREEVDLLFLTEVVFEGGPSSVNQVRELAELAGFHAWCYGDNYRYGIPGFRIRSGNALLSRFPLRGGRVEQLVGGSPFWNPTGNRRLLRAEAELAGVVLECCVVRNDSFDLENNAAQVRQILELLGDGPILLGGDFNAEPQDESLALLRDSGRFRGVFEGASTYPAEAPKRRIDSILIPSHWTGRLEQRVLDEDLSDHEPVLVVIRPE